MTAGEIGYVGGALLAVMAICSLPIFGSLRGAGPRYRAVLVRQLGIGWGVAALTVGWLALGWWALAAGPRYWTPYRDFTLVLMGASVPLLAVGIRVGNRSAAAAQAADRGSPA